MQKGITIYPGLDNSPDENMHLIETAASYGFTRAFFVVLLPYAEPARAQKELGPLMQHARRCQMEIIASLTPAVMKAFGMKEPRLKQFRMLGIQAVYLQDFSMKDIADLSRNSHGIRILINASTVTAEDVAALDEHEANLAQMDALHSCYAREGTGMSEEILIQKTVLLHHLGIRVGAFIPSNFRKRSPICAGLPSLEMHRTLPAELAGRHYAAIGMDSVFLSDSLPSKDEIAGLGRIRDHHVQLRVRLHTRDAVQRSLLRSTFTARMDEARDAVRASEGGSIVTTMGMRVKPEHTILRDYGDVTIDNEDCTGYMGEVEIMKRPSPADRRINVAARVREEEAFLINYIIPGKKFRFLFR